MNSKIFLSIFLTAILGIVIYPLVIQGQLVMNLGLLAWVSLVPLFLLQEHLKPSRFFVACFVSGFLFYLGSLYWMVPAMSSFGGLVFWESFGVLLLVAIISATFFSLALYLATKVHERLGGPLFFLNALFIVAIDYLRIYFPVGGFPWPMLGYSQANFLKFFQWVDLTGMFGLTLLIVMVNGIIADFLRPVHAEKRKDILLNRGLIFLLLVFTSFLGSIYRTQVVDEWGSSNEGRQVAGRQVAGRQVALIQGNIAQDLKWNPSLARSHLRTYTSFSVEAGDLGADLVVWPETAYPYSFVLNDLPTRWLVERDALKVPALIGAVSQKDLPLLGEPIIYNSAFLLDQNSQVLGVYHKQHLVPFGEYIPLQKWLKFAKRLTVAVGDFSPGLESTLIDYEGLRIGSLLCFEDIFPDISREFVRQGANILINLTNDAWYGDTSAQYQHLAFSQLRALENRRYLLRSTNTGITAVIDHYGRIVAQLKPFTADMLMRSAPLLTKQSFYTRHGDMIALGAVALCLVLLIILPFRRFTGRGTACRARSPTL